MKDMLRDKRMVEDLIEQFKFAIPDAVYRSTTRSELLSNKEVEIFN